MKGINETLLYYKMSTEFFKLGMTQTNAEEKTLDIIQRCRKK